MSTDKPGEPLSWAFGPLQSLLARRFDVPETKPHESVVQQVHELGWQTKRFAASMATTMVGHSCERRCQCRGGFCLWDDVRGITNQRPDAFIVTRETPEGNGGGTVILVEVDITHPTSVHKWNNLAWFLDNEAWFLFVVTIERAGVPVLRWSDVDMMHAGLRALQPKAVEA